MSAIVALLDRTCMPPTGAGSHLGRELLDRMMRRGSGPVSIRVDEHAVLGVRRQPWESSGELGNNAGVVTDAACSIAADASLYYRPDLLRRLSASGVAPTGDTASHLILAAYHAWGARCAEYLEGDFAFVLYDRNRRTLVAARDFTGKRPLHFAELAAGRAVFASTIGGVVAHPDCPTDLNLAKVAMDAASAFFVAGDQTCYRAVQCVPPGHTLVWEPAGGLRTTAHWLCPEFRATDSRGSGEATQELRHLLADAVRERLPRSGNTAVWMSGGYDSTAVFGAAMDVRRGASSAGGRLGCVTPISMSYPPDDPGREDELITEVSEFWDVKPQWLQAYDFTGRDEVMQRAALRDEPFGHVFEEWNRGLARGAVSSDARVSFDGNGGDQLFGASEVYLADLFRQGRWATLRREWRAEGGGTPRDFFRSVIRPLIPPRAVRALELLGRRLGPGHLEAQLPPWIRTECLGDLGSWESGRLAPDKPWGRTLADFENEFYFRSHFFSRVFSLVTEFALEEGTELRSPLLDGRLIAFAARRPREERRSGGQNKRLLRAAMAGLVPDSVLLPRAHRTGVVTSFFARILSEQCQLLLASVFVKPLLADLGVIDMDRFRKGCARYFKTGNMLLGRSIFMTLQAELWLKAHDRSSSAGAVAFPAAPLADNLLQSATV